MLGDSKLSITHEAACEAMARWLNQEVFAAGHNNNDVTALDFDADAEVVTISFRPAKQKKA